MPLKSMAALALGREWSRMVFLLLYKYVKAMVFNQEVIGNGRPSIDVDGSVTGGGGRRSLGFDR